MEQKKSQGITVVMPAYNAARTLRKTYGDLPHEIIERIILVDDASQDATVNIAKELNLHIVVHPRNRGYGGNQKTCYIEFLKGKEEIVVMVHPDYQYDPTVIPQMVSLIRKDKADIVFGSRMLIPGGARRGGMPLYKFIANKFLTFLENRAFKRKLSEYHTGLRAYHRRVLESINFLNNSDSFVFDSEITAEAVAKGFRIDEIPIETRYTSESSCINLTGSICYGLKTLWVVFTFWLRHRIYSRLREPGAMPDKKAPPALRVRRFGQYIGRVIKRIMRFTLIYRSKININSYKGWISQTDKVIDVGCGNGVVSIEIKNNFGCEIVGVDTLDYLKVSMPFKLMISENKIPFDDNSFDVAMFNDVLHHVNEPDVLLKEACRVAKKVLIFEHKPGWIVKCIDRVANMIHNPYMKVPLTFKTAPEWRKLFQKLQMSCKFRNVKKLFILWPIKSYAFILNKKPETSNQKLKAISR
jgi:glycosyltransferase involved in cell wall biosynthesis